MRTPHVIRRKQRPPYRGPMSRPTALLAGLGVLLLSACAAEAAGQDRDASPAPGARSSSSTAPSSTAPAPAAPPPSAAGCEGPAVVDVTDADGLQHALDGAAPGQVIRLADGRYEGSFVAEATASADAPIRLCGSRSAVLDGGDIEGDYTLHLSGASFWQVSGFTVTGGQKGVMVDEGTGNRIEGLLVTSMGDEAIHLRTNSTDNVVAGNTIRDTGLRKPKFGEGVYVGSAESNWCQVSDCEPDRSDRNLVEGNDIAGTTAEAVDIKEGTSDGTLRGNVFDGSDMVEADSWVDVKGNGWTVEGNVGTSSPGDGFQVHEVVDGWGRGTVFSGNSVSDVEGMAVNAAGPRALRNSTTMYCDGDDGEGARGGAGNIDCTDR
jgi:nitrous oxidase accessory protein NosD